jgi:hypothetical protein
MAWSFENPYLQVARRIARQSIIAAGCVAFGPFASAQQNFATPQQASQALVSALKSNERREILNVVGRSAFDILSSGDDVADELARKRFVEQFDQRHRIVMHGDLEATLVTGSADAPFSIPLVRLSQGWQFDIATGRQEMLRARIARNEGRAVETLAAFVKAQRDYADMAAAKEGAKRYAQRIISRPDQKDGLYWPASGAEARSPLNDLVERAKADGYSFGSLRAAYHGYRFKVLLRQGSRAAGGSIDYNEKGRMTRGFALIAYPAQYGHSGVLSFMVNQSGVIYQKDLGAYSTRSADREVWFNPDQTWRKVAQTGGGL